MPLGSIVRDFYLSRGSGKIIVDKGDWEWLFIHVVLMKAAIWGYKL